MKLFTKNDLANLMNTKMNPSITFYLPAYKAGPETRQNPIRLNNLIKKAQDRLERNTDMRLPEIKNLLEPVNRLLNDKDFWEHQNNGLAIYLNNNSFFYYRMPIEFDELLIISDHFHVKPLIPLITDNGRFYILNLSMNETRFFQCTHYNIQEIKVQGMPQNIYEVSKYYDAEKQLQYHTGNSNNNSAIFHGHGSGKDHKENEIKEYIRLIAKSIKNELADERDPLVVASVDYLFAIYKDLNTYNYLLNSNVSGSPDGISPEEIHKKAWPIVEPHFLETKRQALSLYNELSNKERTLENIEDIVPASYYSRVEYLFTVSDHQRWGDFDTSKNKVKISNREEKHSKDLLNFAAVHSIINGGKVYVLSEDEMPENKDIAAVLRY